MGGASSARIRGAMRPVPCPAHRFVVQQPALRRCVQTARIAADQPSGRARKPLPSLSRRRVYPRAPASRSIAHNYTFALFATRGQAVETPPVVQVLRLAYQRASRTDLALNRSVFLSSSCVLTPLRHRRPEG